MVDGVHGIGVRGRILAERRIEHVAEPATIQLRAAAVRVVLVPAMSRSLGLDSMPSMPTILNGRGGHSSTRHRIATIRGLGVALHRACSAVGSFVRIPSTSTLAVFQQRSRQVVRAVRSTAAIRTGVAGADGLVHATTSTQGLDRDRVPSQHPAVAEVDAQVRILKQTNGHHLQTAAVASGTPVVLRFVKLALQLVQLGLTKPLRAQALVEPVHRRTEHAQTEHLQSSHFEEMGPRVDHFTLWKEPHSTWSLDTRHRTQQHHST